LHHVIHKGFCGMVGECAVKRLGDNVIDAKGIQKTKPFFRGGEILEILFPPQDNRRMRGKGKHHRRRPLLVCPGDKPAQYLLVTPMDPVKYADGQPGILKGYFVDGMRMDHVK
jgi:hypothetical protein